MAPFKLSLFVALFIAIPYVLYQVWAFVAPGLYKHEKRFAMPLILSSILLFYTGVAFAYFVVFPLMFAFFATTAPDGVQMMTGHHALPGFRPDDVPRVRRRLRSADRGGAARGHRHRERRDTDQERGYVLIGIFVIAAFLTPPDAISQCIMAVPMYLLYEGGMVMARILLVSSRRGAQPKNRARAADPEP